MLKLKGWGVRLYGYAGFGQELKVSGLGIVLCSMFIHEGEIVMHVGSAAWNLFEPGLEIAHRRGAVHCELSVVDASGKPVAFRYRRKDPILAIIDSTYNDWDFELANLPATLPSLSRRNKAELVEEWSARTAVSE